MMRNILLFAIAFVFFACASVKNAEESSEALPDPSTMHFEMQKKGVDFFAEDLDAEWALEIDYDSKVKFKAKALKTDFEVNVLTLGSGLKGSEATHEVKNSDGVLTVTIKCHKEPFKDGEACPYEVDIRFNDLKSNKEFTYKGVGMFYGDIRLHDKWVLVEINSEKMEASKLPSMEIHLDKNKAMGFLGCNNYSADVYFGKEQITFSSILSTKKGCADDNIEPRFSKALRGNTFGYRFDDSCLMLENEMDTLRFKKGE